MKRKNTVVILSVLAVVLFLAAVQVLFTIQAPCKWLDAVWEPGEFITFAGTVSLGIVAVYQTKKANDVSERLLAIEEERRRPQIDIRPISEKQRMQCDRQHFIASSTDDTYVFVDENWRETFNKGDDFWFAIKNVRDTDVLNIAPIEVTPAILDAHGRAQTVLEKQQIATSCRLDHILGGETVPFLLGTEKLWTRVAEKPGQRLRLSIEFLLTNSDGEKYLQTVELQMMNAYNSGILTPAIIQKNVGKARKYETRGRRGAVEDGGI